MSNACVKEKLLTVIDDIEMISKELFETMLTPKPQRMQSGHNFDHSQIADLLVLKDKELKKCLAMASEQEEIQKKMDSLKAEVEKQDDEIRQLQKHLKEAEHILATAIYQAKQKLESIAKASEKQISSEELIKYAHRISSSHAVAAPYNWEQGDPRRPYPTDIEMRSGVLGQSDLPMTTSLLQQQQLQQQQQQQQNTAYNAQGPQQQQQQQPAPPELPRPSSTASTSSSSNFAWNSQQDMKPNLSALTNAMQQPGGIETKPPNKDNVEDVEVMSTDSSSSSSSDSQ